MRICIDPGHGGYDPGAVGPSGLLEKDVTLAISKLLAKELYKYDIVSVLTRDSDDTPWNEQDDLQKRAKIANWHDADCFISVHCNSATNPQAHGLETYCFSRGNTSEELASTVQCSMVESLQLADRGVKTANFYVLRHTQMPAILVEIGFINNPAEEGLLAAPAFQEKAAQAIAKGITTHCGIQIVQEVLDLFKDVPKDHWAAGSIEKLAKLGIIKGDGQGNFRPDEPITRAEDAVLHDRMLEYILKLLGRQIMEGGEADEDSRNEYKV